MQPSNTTGKILGIALIVVLLGAIAIVLSMKKGEPQGASPVSEERGEEISKELEAPAPAITPVQAEKVKAELQKPPGGAPTLSEEEIERIRKELSQ
jgi:hypothetical protein